MPSITRSKAQAPRAIARHPAAEASSGRGRLRVAGPRGQLDALSRSTSLSARTAGGRSPTITTGACAAATRSAGPRTRTRPGPASSPRRATSGAPTLSMPAGPRAVEASGSALPDARRRSAQMLSALALAKALIIQPERSARRGQHRPGKDQGQTRDRPAIPVRRRRRQSVAASDGIPLFRRGQMVTARAGVGDDHRDASAGPSEGDLLPDRRTAPPALKRTQPGNVPAGRGASTATNRRPISAGTARHRGCQRAQLKVGNHDDLGAAGAAPGSIAAPAHASLQDRSLSNPGGVPSIPGARQRRHPAPAIRRRGELSVIDHQRPADPLLHAACRQIGHEHRLRGGDRRRATIAT